MPGSLMDLAHTPKKRDTTRQRTTSSCSKVGLPQTRHAQTEHTHRSLTKKKRDTPYGRGNAQLLSSWSNFTSSGLELMLAVDSNPLLSCPILSYSILPILKSSYPIPKEQHSEKRQTNHTTDRQSQKCIYCTAPCLRAGQAGPT